MSLTVSPPIPVNGPRGHHSLRVISSPKEGRVVLFIQVGGLPATITLDLEGARALRAALPKPSP